MFAILLLSIGAEPTPFVVENKVAPQQFTVVNRVGDPTGEGPNPHTPYDPYGHGTYESFRKAVEAGGKGILVVGVKDRYVGSYHVHCWVKTGWEGFADGEYDAYLLNGKPVMEKREVKPAAPPKAQESGSTPTINAIGVVVRSTSSSGSTATVRTLTGAVPVVTSGFTENCPPSG